MLYWLALYFIQYTYYEALTLLSVIRTSMLANIAAFTTNQQHACDANNLVIAWFWTYIPSFGIVCIVQSSLTKFVSYLQKEAAVL